MSTTAPRFLTLLRGLNVGGQNVIGKGDLIRCFEDLGFDGVRAYIQSGNVLFRSNESRVAVLTRAIEARLSERLSNRVRAVVLTRARYRAALAAAPEHWGRKDDRKHNALFTLRGVTHCASFSTSCSSSHRRNGRPVRRPQSRARCLSARTLVTSSRSGR